MAKFTDAAGREWDVTITAWAIRSIKSAMGFDVVDIKSGDVPYPAKLMTDDLFLADMLWAICKPECEAQDVSEDAFFKGLDGATLKNANKVLMQELIRYFDSTARPQLSASLKKFNGAYSSLVDAAVSKIDSMDVATLVKDAIAAQEAAEKAAGAV